METRFEHGLLFSDGVKAIHKWQMNAEEIYDLEEDPAERSNLRDELGEEGDRRMALLRQYYRAHAGKRQNGEAF